VRIVTWNCNDAFASKYPRLEELDFDVAVVDECRPVQLSPSGRELTYAMQQAGRGAAKSIGVFARDPWSVRRIDLEAAQDMLWVLPAHVSGPVDFTLLGVHTYQAEDTGSYQSQIHRIVEEVLPEIKGPVVLAGDFNAPYPSAAEDNHHRLNVERLRDQGMVSAFESRHGLEVAPETARTYFHHRKLHSRPLQIDHIFVPISWSASLQYTALGFEKWVAQGPSDHVPVIADVRIPEHA
jgi:exonuclease III